MAQPSRTPGVMPSHFAFDHEVNAAEGLTRHTFEANAHHRTAVVDGVVTMRVVHGRVQVVGAAGHEAWAIGSGELVVLGGPGPYEIVALEASELWLGKHRGDLRGPRLRLA